MKPGICETMPVMYKATVMQNFKKTIAAVGKMITGGEKTEIRLANSKSDILNTTATLKKLRSGLARARTIKPSLVSQEIKADQVCKARNGSKIANTLS